MQHQGVSFSRTQRFSSFCGLIRGKFTEKLKRKATPSARPAWKNVGKTLSFPSETSTAKISSLENDFTLTHARNFLVDFSFFNLDPPQPRPNERPTDRRQEQKCKTFALGREGNDFYCCCFAAATPRVDVGGTTTHGCPQKKQPANRIVPLH